jgi:hypothetical protein
LLVGGERGLGTGQGGVPGELGGLGS